MAVKIRGVVESGELEDVMGNIVSRLTLEEFQRHHGGDNAELIDGVVVPLVPAGNWCGLTGLNVAVIFGTFDDDNKLGIACSNDTFVLIRKDPPRVRGADFCYWTAAAVTDEVDDAIIDAPPELCVEMRSPTYDWPCIFGKVADYLSAGVKAVLVLDPYTKTASLYRPTAPPEAFTCADELTLPDVLPGFSAPVARFFE